MKKKTLTAILSLATGICCLGAFTACNSNSAAWSDVYVNDNGELVISFEDGTEKNLGVIVGTDGTDGTNGTNGIDGVDGVDGADGKDGKDGIDGIDGTNAVNITDIESNAVYADNGDIEFTFVFTFDDDTTKEVTCTLKEPVAIQSVELFNPNFKIGEDKELQLLVTYTDGNDEVVPVTEDMIEGTIDFTVKGNYEISITYKGKTYNFTVKVI